MTARYDFLTCLILHIWLLLSRIFIQLTFKPRKPLVATTVYTYFEMEKILIEKVREHEFLYNTVAPNYRDPIIRQEAWDEIGKQLKITGKL